MHSVTVTMANVLEDALLFHGIPLNGLASLAKQGRERLFHQGDILMREGEPSDLMYVIVQGRVGVDRGHPALLEPIRVAELGPGETAGEMGLLDGDPRSATVVALEETYAISELRPYKGVPVPPEPSAKKGSSGSLASVVAVH